MTDALAIQIKYAVDPMPWAFGQRHQSIWMDFVSMIILKTCHNLHLGDRLLVIINGCLSLSWATLTIVIIPNLYPITTNIHVLYSMVIPQICHNVYLGGQITSHIQQLSVPIFGYSGSSNLTRSASEYQWIFMHCINCILCIGKTKRLKKNCNYTRCR